MTHSSHKIRIFLLDGLRLSCEALGSRLAQEGDLHVVGMATTINEALPLAQTVCFDVLLLDIHVPDLDLTVLFDVLQQSQQHCRIVVLATSQDLSQLMTHPRVSSYVLRDISIDHLLETIRAAARGHILLQPSIAQHLFTTFGLTPQSFVSRHALLSAQERRIMALISSNYSNTMIADTLCITEGTVKSHLTNIYSKLGVHKRHQAVARARELGVI